MVTSFDSSNSVAWEDLERCENGRRFKARLCTIVTHLSRIYRGTLIILAQPQADAHGKRKEWSRP